jgi:hypothetical protein
MVPRAALRVRGALLSGVVVCVFLSMKTYTVHIQFVARGYTVRAKTSAEARKKALIRVGRLNAARLVDRPQMWTDRIDP